VTDAELVELARAGDAAAFGELVERHRSAVFRTALAACRSHEDAEEIAQDAFLAAWRTLASFRGEAQFKTWMLTITWRRALDRRESTWRRLKRFISTDEPAMPLLAQDGPTPEQQLAARELADDVRSVLETLPARFRDPLLLLASGTCTYDEMAVVLRTPVGTLKWRVMEARRRLKARLQERGYEVTS
jgi:RNA polymerase sigma-70 factor (ECF subfamily)